MGALGDMFEAVYNAVNGGKTEETKTEEKPADGEKPKEGTTASTETQTPPKEGEGQQTTTQATEQQTEVERAVAEAIAKVAPEFRVKAGSANLPTCLLYTSPSPRDS